MRHEGGGAWPRGPQASIPHRRATAGGYGWRVGKSLGLGFVHPEYAEHSTPLEIEILDTRKTITIIPESPYDPENERLRG